MSQNVTVTAQRQAAVACASRIYHRPERHVDGLLTSFADLADDEYPGRDGVARACYQLPIRTGATFAVFELRTLHWPMLNLLDAADRHRRAFADAMAEFVEATRRQARERTPGMTPVR